MFSLAAAGIWLNNEQAYTKGNTYIEVQEIVGPKHFHPACQV
jgi:hypothetical protein